MSSFNSIRSKSNRVSSTKKNVGFEANQQLNKVQISSMQNDLLKKFASQAIKKGQQQISHKRKSEIINNSNRYNDVKTSRQKGQLKKIYINLDEYIQTMVNFVNRFINSSEKLISLLNITSSFEIKVAYKLYNSDKNVLTSFLQQHPIPLYTDRTVDIKQSVSPFKLGENSTIINSYKGESNGQLFNFIQNINKDINQVQVNRLSKLLRNIYQNKTIEEYLQVVNTQSKIKKLINYQPQSNQSSKDWLLALSATQKKLILLQKQLIQMIKIKIKSSDLSDEVFIQMQKIRQIIKSSIYPKIYNHKETPFHQYKLSQILENFISSLSNKKNVSYNSPTKFQYHNKANSLLFNDCFDSYNDILIFKQQSKCINRQKQYKQQKNTINYTQKKQLLDHQKTIQQLVQNNKLLKSKNNKLQKEYEFYKVKLNSLEKQIENMKKQNREQNDKYLDNIKHLQNQLKNKIKKEQFTKLNQQKIILQEKNKINFMELQKNLNQKDQIIKKLQTKNSQSVINNENIQFQFNNKYNKVCIEIQQIKLRLSQRQQEIKYKIKQILNKQQQIKKMKQDINLIQIKLFQTLRQKEKLMLQYEIKIHEINKKKDQQILQLKNKINQNVWNQSNQRQKQNKIQYLSNQLLQTNQILNSTNIILQSLKQSMKQEKDKYNIQLQRFSKKQEIYNSLQKQTKSKIQVLIIQKQKLNQQILIVKQSQINFQKINQELIQSNNNLKNQVKILQQKHKIYMQQLSQGKDIQIQQLKNSISFIKQLKNKGNINQKQQQQVIKLKQNILQLTSKINQLKQEKQSLFLSFQQKIQQKQIIIKNSKSSLDQHLLQIQQMKSTIKMQEQLLMIYNQQKLNQVLKNMQHLQTQKNIQIQRLKNKLVNQQNKIQQYLKNSTRYELRINNLIMENKQLESKNQKYILQINNLQKDHCLEKSVTFRNEKLQSIQSIQRFINQKNNQNKIVQQSLQLELQRSYLQKKSPLIKRNSIDNKLVQQLSQKIISLQQRQFQLRNLIQFKDQTIQEYAQKIQFKKQQQTQKQNLYKQRIKKINQNMLQKSQNIKKMKLQLQKSLKLIQELSDQKRKLKEQFQKSIISYKSDFQASKRSISMLKQQLQNNKNKYQNRIQQKNQIINFLNAQIAKLKLTQSQKKVGLQPKNQLNELLKKIQELSYQLQMKQQKILKLQKQLSQNVFQNTNKNKFENLDLKNLKLQLAAKEKQIQYMRFVFLQEKEPKSQMLKSYDPHCKQTAQKNFNSIRVQESQIISEPKHNSSIGKGQYSKILFNLQQYQSQPNNSNLINQLKEQIKTKEQLYENVLQEKNQIIKDMKIKYQKSLEQKNYIIQKLNSKIADLEMDGTNVHSSTIQQNRIKQIKKFKNTLSEILVQTQKKVKSFEQQNLSKANLIKQITQKVNQIMKISGLNSWKVYDNIIDDLKMIKDYIQKEKINKISNFRTKKNDMSPKNELNIFNQQELTQKMIQSQIIEITQKKKNKQCKPDNKQLKKMQRQKIENFMISICQQKQTEQKLKSMHSSHYYKKKSSDCSKLSNRSQLIGFQNINLSQQKNLQENSPFKRARESFTSAACIQNNQQIQNDVSPQKIQLSKTQKNIQVSPVSLARISAIQTINQQHEWMEQLSHASSQDQSFSINSDQVDNDFDKQTMQKLSCKDQFNDQQNSNPDIQKSLENQKIQFIVNTSKKSYKQFKILVRDCQNKTLLNSFQYQGNNSQSSKNI